jgi:hypothetical protein
MLTSAGSPECPDLERVPRTHRLSDRSGRDLRRAPLHDNKACAARNPHCHSAYGEAELLVAALARRSRGGQVVDVRAADRGEVGVDGSGHRGERSPVIQDRDLGDVGNPMVSRGR